MKNALPRICFFGCGAMAVRHARILRKLFPRIELSFASREAARARETARRLKGKEAYGTYEEAARSEQFDISFITTPHAYHADLAVMSAEGGKDIIVEKPVTRTLEELDLLQEAVDRNGVRCTVAENYLYKPIIPVIRRFIEEGLIGEVLFLELSKTGREEKSGWRLDEGLMGGGALLEGGVHWLNALASLAGAVPEEVIAVRPAVSYPSDIPVEDTLFLVVRFSNGAVGRLLHSWHIPSRFFGLGLSKIHGTEGVITFESNGLFCSVFGKKKRKRLVSPLDFLGFKAMHRAFVEDWSAGRPWEPSLARIRTELSLVHAAYRSLASKRFEPV
jgi:predicted dehydrogenase